jgi:DHA1 family bicyclomycin/chloramphenicol resistance-like MFS transporter
MTAIAAALSDAAVAVPQRPRAPLWLLALFAFSATLGMHVFVPALPNAARDLGASSGAMQMTVSLYILGLAIGQLVYGPLSDRFGRRPVLIGGLVLFTVGGFGAALAPGVHALIAARLFQALGGCSGLVLARAIVRDTATTREAGRRLALMNLMVTLGPGVAPLVGGALAAATGWRSIFILLCALGIANLLFAWRLLEETAPEASSVNAATLAHDYWGLLRSPAFLGYSIGGGCATTSLYAFLAAAPFIFIDRLHRPPTEVGGYLALLVSGVWLGSVLASRLIAKVSLGRLLIGANALGCAAAIALLALVLADRLSVALVIGTMFVFTIGVGVAAPAALTQAISVNNRVVGSASGLYGFTQMAVGALCTALAGLGKDAALSAALVLAAASLIGQASFWIAARRPRPEQPFSPQGREKAAA